MLSPFRGGNYSTTLAHYDAVWGGASTPSETEAEVVQVIRALAAEGRTMLLVTHDMKMARDVASHVIFLHQGKIEEEGPPEEVFGNTKSERLRQFLSSTH